MGWGSDAASGGRRDTTAGVKQIRDRTRLPRSANQSTSHKCHRHLPYPGRTARLCVCLSVMTYWLSLKPTSSSYDLVPLPKYFTLRILAKRINARWRRCHSLVVWPILASPVTHCRVETQQDKPPTCIYVCCVTGTAAAAAAVAND